MREEQHLSFIKSESEVMCRCGYSSALDLKLLPTTKFALVTVGEAVLQLAVVAVVFTGHVRPALLQSVCPGAGVPARAPLHVLQNDARGWSAPSRAMGTWACYQGCGIDSPSTLEMPQRSHTRRAIGNT